MELTNSLRKTIASLGQAKVRRETGWFMAEGTKCVLETIGSFKPVYIFATAEWLQSHNIEGVGVIQVTQKDVDRMSQLQSPQSVIAVYEIPQDRSPEPGITNNLTLALDHVQDPGNMGTILRIADWFGIHTVLASADTVDVYNPKVVQATMGAIARVKVIYCNLPDALAEFSRNGVPVYGTFLNGENIYHAPLTKNGIIVMGNEGNGISSEVAQLVNSPLFIPPYPASASTVESLNVSVATAVTVAEFRRRFE